jgi:GTPase
LSTVEVLIMFIDKASIYVTAGRGGAGSISFRREKFVPLGGPDGGNGGKGGDVYLEASHHLTTLLDFKYKPHFKAPDGFPGSACNCSGKSAEDLVIKVPLGTVVTKNDVVVADLKTDSERILIAKSGRGGRGNASFKTSRNTAPRICERGEPGEQATLDLELKLIADVGLVGLPNAGKSTLLSRISAAHPKIADYPFTTLTPNLGVVRYKDTSFVVADIPGLIEGSHTGKGLGDEFLRHIERTRILVHMVDVFGFDGNSAYDGFKTINAELKSHSKKLINKPMLIAANKTDLTGSKEKIATLQKRLKGKKIFPVSAATGKGLEPLMLGIFKALKRPLAEEDETKQERVKKYVYEPEFIVSKEDGIFYVRGKKVETLAQMTDFNKEESLKRFQNILKKLGVEKALLKEGIESGDTVRVSDQELVFEPM